MVEESGYDDEYIEQLLQASNLSTEMLEEFLKEHKDIFDIYDQLVDEVNKCNHALTAALKEVKEETKIGPHRRTFTVKSVIDTDQFMLVHSDVVQKHPQLVKEIDPKQVVAAIKAEILPEEAGRFITKKEIWQTRPKPKIVVTKLRP